MQGTWRNVVGGLVGRLRQRAARRTGNDGGVDFGQESEGGDVPHDTRDDGGDLAGLAWLECIGQGTFAEVWKVRGRSGGEAGQLLAAKCVSLRRMAEDDRALLRTEVSIWRLLHHPHLLALQRVVTVRAGWCYLFSELMEESLCETHARMVRLQIVPRIMNIVRNLTQLASALEYMHSLRVLHRDIKSPNVLVGGGGAVVKLADFGLSRFVSANPLRPMTGETGSYRWMAPEIIRHEAYDAKCDVYSFGVLMCECVTLRVPFRHLSPVEVAFAVARDHARPPLPPLPASIADLICACWARDPRDRPASAKVHDALWSVQARKESYGCLQVLNDASVVV